MARGPDIESSQAPSQSASIVLIGFRGVGKSTLGLITATHLNRPFIDADRALSSFAGCSPNEYVQKHSWDKFRDLETDVLRRILSQYAQGCVIACGGGVVEREENRELLLNHGRRDGMVIHITREKEEVIRYLVNEKDRPQWGEEIRSVWARRFPLFEDCSTHTYVTLTAHNKPKAPSLMLKEVEVDCLRYIDLLLRTVPAPIPLDRRTFSLSIDCPVPQQLDARTLEDATSGVDVMELRVDSLRRPADRFQTSPDTPLANPGCPDLTYIAFTVAHLRRVSRLPIIYSLRTTMQGGLFEMEDSTAPDYARLAEAAFKCGVEYLELGLDVDEQVLRSILSKKPPYVRIILSYYDAQRCLRWDSPDTLAKYRQGSRLGADIVKLVLHADNIDETLQLHRFHEAAAMRTEASVPLIAYNVGQLGKMSSLFNHLYTPLHSLRLPFPVVPGTTTFVELQQALLACGLSSKGLILCQPGESGQQSRIDLFRKGICKLGLPLVATEDERGEPGMEWAGATGSFGVKTDDAKALHSAATQWIGQCDTIVGPTRVGSLKPQGLIQYHNAKTLAIASAVSSNLSPINAVTAVSVALLIGARGSEGRAAAYALLHLGVSRVLTMACDDSMVDNETFFAVSSTDPPSRNLPTIIISCSINYLADLETHQQLLQSHTGGVIVGLDGPASLGLDSVRRHSKCREAWIEVSPSEVDELCMEKQFELVTGHRITCKV